MATVNKDFKIKSGLIVEGTTATVNGYDVLTKKQADQDYVVNLIGGTATSANEANKVVKRDASGNFAAGTITADLTGDVTGDLTGNVTGNVTGDLTGDVTGQVSDISNHSTSDLTEGTNLYFTDGRARSAIAAGTGIDYNSATGYIDANLGTGLGLDGSSQIEIDRTTVDAWYDAAGTAATEAGYVASDLTDHENATVAHGATGAVVGTTNTQTLTNKTIGDTLNFTGAGAMTINSDSHIVLTPAAGSSVKWGSDVLATQDYADTAADTAANNAETDAKDYTDLLLGDATIDGTGGNTVTDRIASAVADLVDGAPELLDTLNELAEAIGDNVDAQGLAVAIGNKLPLAGGSMSGAIAMGTNKITGLGTPTANADAATKEYADGVAATAQSNAEDYADGLAVNYDPAGTAAGLAGNYDAAGSAATAQSNAEDYADGLAVNYDAAGAAATAQSNAEDYADGLAVNYEPAGAINTAIDALDTDDIEEGATNQYFTDARAKASAGDLLAGATKENIQISYIGGVLNISAENGVADSDTDDLDEGTTNLYFTDVRAVDALEAVVPNFTAVEVNSIAKQVAATVSCPVAGINQAYGFDPEAYRSAEFLVKVAYGSHTEISKVLLTLDSSDNIAITEYGIVGTNGSASTISADISGGNVRLLATTVNNNSTVTVMGTLLV